MAETLVSHEGQNVPDVNFRLRLNGDWTSMTTDDIFGGKNVVVFSLPGAFTPTCSSTHLPRFNELAPVLKKHGVDHHRLRVGQRPLRHGRVGERPGGRERAAAA